MFLLNNYYTIGLSLSPYEIQKLRHLSYSSNSMEQNPAKIEALSWSRTSTFLAMGLYSEQDESSPHAHMHFSIMYLNVSRSQWPRGLRRRSAAAWLLESRVRIPLGTWMFVCCVVLCRKRSLRRADHPSRGVLPCVCMCVIKKPLKGRPKVHPGL
jgi:hypothetical protein